MGRWPWKAAVPIILGQVMKRKGKPAKDPFFGLKPTDDEPVEGRKNNPMMPVGWTKSFQVPGGQKGRAFNTTMARTSPFGLAGMLASA